MKFEKENLVQFTSKSRQIQNSFETRKIVKMPNRVYVGGIGEEIRERDLEKFFKHFKLAGISLKQGYGFVDFDDPRDADDACYELNGKKCCDSR